jgi:hypothetical protein
MLTALPGTNAIVQGQIEQRQHGIVDLIGVYVHCRSPSHQADPQRPPSRTSTVLVGSRLRWSRSTTHCVRVLQSRRTRRLPNCALGWRSSMASRSASLSWGASLQNQEQRTPRGRHKQYGEAPLLPHVIQRAETPLCGSGRARLRPNRARPAGMCPATGPAVIRSANWPR